MYLWVWIVVGLVWLLLVGGSITAWRDGRLGGFLSLCSGLFWTAVAGCVILFALPYWKTVWSVFIQPG